MDTVVVAPFAWLSSSAPARHRVDVGQTNGFLQ
jgi:hypothetical protein